MSDPLRVALVAEGPTERVVIEAALESILNDRRFILQQLQPEESLAFGALGTGWAGVYNWCRQAVARAEAPIRNDVLFHSYDLLILHLDADVADHSYAQGGIVEQVPDLPCSQPCPPPSTSTNPLRKVLLRWCGEEEVPLKTVLCTPSKSTEAWVVSALFPADLAVRRGIECWPHPDGRLGQQPIERRIKKSVSDYQALAGELRNAWTRLRDSLDEARRFDTEIRSAVPAQNGEV
jgi:hypothetical protein